MLLVLWQHFGKGPTVFQHENLTALSNICEEIVFFFSEFGVEDHYRPAESPELSLIQQLWDEV